MFDMVDRGDPAERIRIALKDLGAEARDDWPSVALSERVLELLELRERLGAELVRLLARWDERKSWEADGSLTARAWLTHHAAIAGGDATRLTKAARATATCPALADALATGDTSTAHVDAVARVATPERIGLLTEHDVTITEQATQFPVSDFTRLVNRWASYADDVLAADTHEAQYHQRRLHVSTALDGWSVIDGYLEADTAAALTAALDHLAPPDPDDSPEGPRSLSQRRADALADLAHHYLEDRDGAGGVVTLNTVIDVATLNGDPPTTAAARCEIDGVGDITMSTLDRLACNAAVCRVVMAGASIVLDVGRRTRLVTAAQRRALAIRDRHCRFGSCTRPSQWCDAHHLVPWARGGATDLDNLALLCRRHHTLLHNTKWTLRRHPDGTITTHHPARGP